MKMLSIGERAMYYGVPLFESFDTMLSFTLRRESEMNYVAEHSKRAREAFAANIATNANL